MLRHRLPGGPLRRRWEEDRKCPQFTVYQNGALIHDDYSIPGKTGAGRRRGRSRGPSSSRDTTTRCASATLLQKLSLDAAGAKTRSQGHRQRVGGGVGQCHSETGFFQDGEIGHGTAGGLPETEIRHVRIPAEPRGPVRQVIQEPRLEGGLLLLLRHPGFKGEFKVLRRNVIRRRNGLKGADRIPESPRIAELLEQYPDVFYLWNDALTRRSCPRKKRLPTSGASPDVLVSGNGQVVATKRSAARAA